MAASGLKKPELFNIYTQEKLEKIHRAKT